MIIIFLLEYYVGRRRKRSWRFVSLLASGVTIGSLEGVLNSWGGKFVKNRLGESRSPRFATGGQKKAPGWGLQRSDSNYGYTDAPAKPAGGIERLVD
jgi:hypothetical protein